MSQINKFKYDVIGLCETRAKEETRTRWKDTGDELIIGAGAGQHRIGGVGFIINKRIADRIIEVEVHSPRIATLKIDTGKKRPLLIIQVYAPHSGYADEEIERFYQEVEAKLQQPACQKIIIGDFNAQIGPKTTNQRYIGKFTGDTWTETGELLADFAEGNRMFITNTFFQKPAGKRWTYQSTNANKTRHEIDFGLCSDRHMVQNIEFLSRLDVGSDHRPVRFTLNVSVKANKKRTSTKTGRIFNPQVLQMAINSQDWTTNGTLTEKFDQLQDRLKKCVEASTAAKKEKPCRLTEETQQLLKKRSCMDRQVNPIEFVELCKVIRRKIREDHEAFKLRRLLKTMEERKSLKKCRRQLQQQTATMAALKDKNGKRLTKRIDIEQRCQEFYTELFASKTTVPLEIDKREEEEVPKILISEVREAVKSLKNDKAPGPDGIVNEVLKTGEYTLWKAIASLFNDCLQQEDVPEQWKKSTTVIIPKKGDREDLKNYRPIALLSTIYKVFTKVLVNRITRQLDEQQPREQAGFRRGFSTMDHLQVVNQVLEKSREFQIPLCMVFVDYEKAFDSIETNAVTNALKRQNIPKKYIRTLHNINTGCTTTIQLFYSPINIPIGRGVRQGDTISPKLFTAALEDVFRTLDWENKGIWIDGERLNHLRFADDIILFSYDVKTAESMLQELNEASTKVGLRINRSKTQAMKNAYCTSGTMKLGDEEIEFVDKYVYLGQQVTHDHKIDEEIRRRRSAAWLSFKGIKELLANTKDEKLRAHLFNSTVLPALNYGSETWTVRKTEKNKLQTTQRAMERQILRIKLRDKVRNEEIRRKTRLKDAYIDAQERKIRWAGHIARRADNRWTTRTTFWWPYNYKRPLGRPPQRWRKEIEESMGKNWQQLAKNRQNYKRRLKDLLQEWMN
jgi:hypothetical protein